MISNSFKLNTTYQSNAVVEGLVSALINETEAQEKIAKQEKNLKRHPLALDHTYIRILEAGGHLGC